MGVPRGTTPTFILRFSDSDLDLTAASGVYVTIGNLTKTGADLEIAEKQVSVFLTQSETLSLATGANEIQTNWIYADGRRGASNVTTIELTKQLLGRVLP